MATYFAIQYGSYLYSSTPNKPSRLKDAVPAVLRTMKSPSVDGEYSAGGKVGARRPVLTGWIIASDPNDGGASMRDALASFRSAHAPGAAKSFYVDSDRYLSAEIESLDIAEWKGAPFAQFTANLYCADPFWYASDAAAPTDLNVGSNTITTLGEWTSLPQIVIPINSFTLGAAIEIANTTTGEAITVTPFVDVAPIPTLVIDSYAENLTSQEDGSDQMAAFSSGVFLTLAAGSNTITLATSGTISLGQTTIAWRDRWI